MTIEISEELGQVLVNGQQAGILADFLVNWPMFADAVRDLGPGQQIEVEEP